MTKDSCSPRQWREFHQQFYTSGAWISDEINAAVTDAAFSRPTGSMIPMLHDVDEAERRRVVAGVIRDLAKENGVDRRMTKLCYDFFLAIGRLRSIVGPRKTQWLLSGRCQLSIGRVIALSRRSAKSITQELDSLRKRNPVNHSPSPPGHEGACHARSKTKRL